MTIDTYIAAAVDAWVRATGVPLVGVSIGETADKTTWRVRLTTAATPSDVQTAAGAIASFDLATIPTVALQLSADAEARQKALVTTLVYLWRLNHGNVNPTAQQLQNELTTWKTIYKALT